MGGDVDKSALTAVFDRLVTEARVKFHQKKFEEALHLFKQCQAVCEKMAGRGKHTEFGANAHNIASCLHCLGHFDEARTHYEQALAHFQLDPPSRFWKAVYGDVDRRRCDFVRERLVDLEFGRKPDLDKYLDGFGYKRDVTADLAQPPQRMTTTDAFAIHGAAFGAAPIYAGGGSGVGGYPRMSPF